MSFSFTLLSFFRLSFFLALGGILSACEQETASVASASDVQSGTVLQVLKDPSCGCCTAWIDHMSDRGFVSQISHPADLNGEKLKLGIAPQYQSCHTAISEEGYVFEGHIPANIIQRFMAEMPSDAIGLAVPGMPMGSPGMEIGDQFQPYDVLVLNNDGSSAVYAHIATQAEQY